MNGDKLVVYQTGVGIGELSSTPKYDLEINGNMSVKNHLII